MLSTRVKPLLSPVASCWSKVTARVTRRQDGLHMSVVGLHHNQLRFCQHDGAATDALSLPQKPHGKLPPAAALDMSSLSPDENEKVEKLQAVLHRLMDSLVTDPKVARHADTRKLLVDIEPYIDYLPLITIARTASASWPSGYLSPELHAKMRRVVFHAVPQVETEVVARVFIAWARGRAHAKDTKIFARLAKVIAGRVNELKDERLLLALVRALAHIHVRPPKAFLQLLNRRCVAMNKMHPFSVISAIKALSLLDRLGGLEYPTLLALAARVSLSLEEAIQHQLHSTDPSSETHASQSPQENNSSHNDTFSRSSSRGSTTEMIKKEKAIGEKGDTVYVSEGTAMIRVIIDNKEITVSPSILEEGPDATQDLNVSESKSFESHEVCDGGPRRGKAVPHVDLPYKDARTVYRKLKLSPVLLLKYLELGVQYGASEAVYNRAANDLLRPIMKFASSADLRRLIHVQLNGAHCDTRISSQLLCEPTILRSLRRVSDVELLSRLSLRLGPAGGIHYGFDRSLLHTHCTAHILVGRESPGALLHAISMVFQATDGFPEAREAAAPLLERATYRWRQLANAKKLHENGRRTLRFFAANWPLVSSAVSDQSLPAASTAEQISAKCVQILDECRGYSATVLDNEPEEEKINEVQRKEIEALRRTHSEAQATEAFRHNVDLSPQQVELYAQVVDINSRRVTAATPELIQLRRRVQYESDPLDVLTIIHSFQTELGPRALQGSVRNALCALKFRLVAAAQASAVQVLKTQGPQVGTVSKCLPLLPCHPEYFESWSDPARWSRMCFLLGQHGTPESLRTSADIWKVIASRFYQLGMKTEATKASQKARDFAGRSY